jgi:hypothetical protein
MAPFPQLIERRIKFNFVLVIVSHGAPEQSPGPAPAVENDPVQKCLISRRDDEAIIFSRFLLPGRPPMEHKCLEPEFSQTRANIVNIIGADSALSSANADQVIMNGRVSRNAVFSRELARRVMSGLRQQSRFAWIDRSRRKSDQGTTQIADRLLILRLRGCLKTKDEGNRKDNPAIHIQNPSEAGAGCSRKIKRPGRRSDPAFLSKLSQDETTWTKGLFAVMRAGGCRGGSGLLVLSAGSQT